MLRLVTVAMLLPAPAAAAAAVVPAGPEAGARVERAELPGRVDVPEAAIRALEEKRYFHASLLIREYLATARDTTPAEMLIAARAEAGWGDWEHVERLLAGRAWLDAQGGGLGWLLLGKAFYHSGKWSESRTALERWIAVGANATGRERGFAELYLAHAAREANDAPTALAAYDRAAALLQPVAHWIGLQAVAAAASAGDTAETTRRLAGLEPELAREWGWRHRVVAHLNAGDTAKAKIAAEQSARELRSSNRRAEAWVELGRLRFNTGDVVGAREAFRQAVRAAPGGSGGVAGARMLSTMPGITPDDHLLIGETYLRHGNAERGVAGVQAYLDAGRGTAAEREWLRYRMAEGLFRAGRYDQAERLLRGVVERAIVSSLTPEAMYLQARAQYRSGRQTQARRTFLEVAARFPQTEAAARAMYLSADFDHDDGNIERATERYRRTTALNPDAEEVGLAHMRLGGLAFQRKDWAAAREEFDGYRRRYPNGRRYVQATYWSGLAARQAGDNATATARFEEVFRLEPFTYYGGRAAELLGKSFWDAPLGRAPAPDSMLAARVEAALERVDLLREMDWDAAASWEIDRVRSQFAASRPALYALAEALNARGYTTTGIALGWDLFRQDGGWNSRLLHIIYPFPYQNVIAAEADERGVDPFLVLALIRQESMFHAGAVSYAGAIGLMQVMPATGQSLARQLGIRRFNADLLEHAELNVHLGTRYLSEQLENFSGRVPVVLAAYNAGPHRITRWQEFPEFTDDELFAERIPFAETREYVKVVQNNRRIYEALYRSVIDARRPATN